MMSPDAVAELNRLLAEMSVEDASAVYTIIEAPDQMTIAGLIRDYLRDKDRADRTPRGVLYLFFGFQAAIIETLLDLLRDRSGPVH